MEDLSNIRKYVECPICLGIIREARVVKQCRHRFCKECIEKALRLSNHKCPICRVHCPSRRSLEADKDFDNFVAFHYPNNNQYEEEELVLNNAEVIRNEQTRATFTQKMKRQPKESTHTQIYELSSDGEEDDQSSDDEYIPGTRKRTRREVKEEQSIQTNQTNLVLPESLRWGSTSMRSCLVPETSNVHSNILPETSNVRDNILPDSERKPENRIERLVCHFQNLKRIQEENGGIQQL